MIPPRHIPLTHRKALCGRLLYLDAVNQLGPALPGDRSSYEYFTRLLLEHIELPVLADTKQRYTEKTTSAQRLPLKALDLSLREAVDGFKSVSAYKLVTGDLSSKTIMKSVTGALSVLSCQTCSSSNDICEGLAQTNDDDLVHRKGACISQLRQMFEVAHDAAKAYYAAYASNFPSNPSPDIVFSTGHTEFIPEKEHPLEGFYAGAVTRFIDESGQARAEVKLKLTLGKHGFKLDLYTYKGILYVLFHECIAHAFHGLLPTFDKRWTSDPFDSFSEGFMDRVAFEVLKESVEDTGLASSLNLRNRIVFLDSLKAAGKMSFERNECDFDEVVTNKADIALGVKAAEASFELMKTAYKSEDFGPIDDFKRGFYQLAFDLNLRQDVDRNSRRDFVTLMYCYHILCAIKPGNRNVAMTLALSDIHAAIVNYLRTRSITTLIIDTQNMLPKLAALEGLSN